MKKRLARISPLQLGIVLAVLYALVSLIILIPLGAIASLSSLAMHQNGMSSGPSFNTAFPAVFSGVFLVVMPVLYAFFGFIGGVIAAAIYNLVARFTGGIEVTVEDVPEV